MTQSKDFCLIAAPFTPMNPDGEVEFERIGPLAGHLHRQGVDGAFICGTTGEGLSLTMTERRHLAEAWRAATDGLELIVHVGHTCPNDAQDLARHAQALRADGIAAIGPCFFEADDAAVLADYCAQIASAAPETPFYYYHMPSMARVAKVKASAALEEMAARIPSFAGLKFTHEDVADYRRCLEIAGGRWRIFFGRDEMLFDALRCGARCAVGSTYNFAARLYREIIRAHDQGDDEGAEKIQKLASEGIRILIESGGLPAIKAMMGIAVMDCGAARLPLRVPDSRRVAQMQARLEEIGYLEGIKPTAAPST